MCEDFAQTFINIIFIFLVGKDSFRISVTLQKALMLVPGEILRLSEEEILNCTKIPTNRNPMTSDAFNYMQSVGVLSLKAVRRKPLDERASCKHSETDYVTRISRYHLLEPEDQDNLKLAVALIGPISISIKVTENFFSYKRGVFYDTLCQNDAETPNHAVVLVGYGIHSRFGEYWKVLNSWGTGWGEDGYARMARNTIINCDIPSAAFFVEM